MTRPLVIFGAGGHGREVLQLVRDINAAGPQPAWDCLGFLVDGTFLARAPATVGGLPVLGDPAWLAAHPEVSVALAIGAPAARRLAARRIRALGSNPFPVLVHPRAWIGANVTLGEGTLVCAGAMLTVDITVGAHVHLNVASTLAHDDLLEDFVTLSPGVHVAGNVVLEEGAELGVGCAVIPRCTVGAWSVLGAGAVVTGAIEADCTAVGAPARAVKRRAPGWHES
jgi:sugar O-acyltransferase (sialic acid O-acetyltransferase NeuD family)